MSQQSDFVLNYFNKQRGGFFIDVGANDGITESNTFDLENNYDWRGICIEPHPVAYAKLTINRPCCTNYRVVASNYGDRRIDFVQVNGYAEMLSGILNEYDERHLSRIDKEIQEHGGSKKIISVPCRFLSEIFEEQAITEIDYLSVDVEGGELSVLQSIDWYKVKPALISVENNYNKSDCYELIMRHGYKYLTKIAADDFYEKINP